MKNWIIWTITFCFLFLIEGQAQTYTLRGSVIDQKTKEALIAVNIYNQTEDAGSFSDIIGRFEIKITRWPTTLIFSYLGYENYAYTISEAPEGDILIQLEVNSLRLPGIEIIAAPKVSARTN